MMMAHIRLGLLLFVLLALTEADSQGEESISTGEEHGEETQPGEGMMPPPRRDREEPRTDEDMMPPPPRRDREEPRTDEDRMPPPPRRDREEPRTDEDRMPPPPRRDREEPRTDEDRMPPPPRRDREEPRTDEDRMPPPPRRDREEPRTGEDRMPPHDRDGEDRRPGDGMGSYGPPPHMPEYPRPGSGGPSHSRDMDHGRKPHQRQPPRPMGRKEDKIEGYSLADNISTNSLLEITGRLQVKKNGTWGTVCSDNFTWVEADVFCRKLNYSRAVGVVKAERMIPDQSSMPIWLDGVVCPPRAPSLDFCCHNELGVTDCKHNQDVWIKCTNNTEFRPPCCEEEDDQKMCVKCPSNHTDGDMMPAQPDMPTTGNMESADDDMCDPDSMMMPERPDMQPGMDPRRDVVDEDRQDGHMGYPGPDRRPSAVDGSPDEDESPGMRGEDDSSMKGDGRRYGSGGRDRDMHPRPAARCGHRRPHHKKRSGRLQGIRVMGMTSRKGVHGRLEVKYDGEWGTVCSDGINWPEANVFCHHLGYRNAINITTRDKEPCEDAPSKIWLDGVHCPARAPTFDFCCHNEFGVHNCEHNQDVFIHCTNEPYFHPPCCQSNTKDTRNCTMECRPRKDGDHSEGSYRPGPGDMDQPGRRPPPTRTDGDNSDRTDPPGRPGYPENIPMPGGDSSQGNQRCNEIKEEIKRRTEEARQRIEEEVKRQDEIERSRRNGEGMDMDEQRRQDEDRRREDEQRLEDERRLEEERQRDEQRRKEEEERLRDGGGQRGDEREEARRRAEERRREEERRRAEERRRQDKTRRQDERRREEERRRSGASSSDKDMPGEENERRQIQEEIRRRVDEAKRKIEDEVRDRADAAMCHRGDHGGGMTPPGNMRPMSDEDMKRRIGEVLKHTAMEMSRKQGTTEHSEEEKRKIEEGLKRLSDGMFLRIEEILGTNSGDNNGGDSPRERTPPSQAGGGPGEGGRPVQAGQPPRLPPPGMERKKMNRATSDFNEGRWNRRMYIVNAHNSDKYDWSLTTGVDASQGPTSDYDTASSSMENGYFAYADGSKGENATLMSGSFRSNYDMCLSFWYSVHGNSDDDLALRINRVPHPRRGQDNKLVASLNGPTTGGWIQYSVKLSGMVWSQKGYLEFTASTPAKRGSVAIDDISVREGEC